jgi:parallel beta-helix repeat protein
MRYKEEISMTTYYVSTQGNDSAAGTSTSAAFATLGRAAQAMGITSSADVSYVMDGAYSVSAPVSLTGKNSNDTIAGYEGANPILTGGMTVGGWIAGGDGVWTAKLENIAEVQQFVVNGARQIEARYPNYDAGDPVKGGWLWAKDVPSGHSATLEMAYNKADFPGGQPMAGEKVTVFSQLGYSSDVLTVASVDTAAGIIKFAEPASYDIGSGSRYFVAGAKPLLDSVGEWWFDKPAHTLYYKPAVSFDGSKAVVSSELSLIDINGASNVTVKGLSFSDAATRASSDDISTAAIKLTNSDHITLDNNHFLNVAKGIAVQEGSNHVTIANSEFNHIWSTAIELASTSHENFVSNNRITHSGEVFRTTGAVQMEETWGNTISHNLVQDVPRFAIAEINWSPGDKSGGNTIEYNQILRAGQETPDVGAIYAYSGEDPGALGDIIRFNEINDAGGLATNGSGFVNGRYMSAGIYLDDLASNAQIYGNFVKGTWFGGVYLHGGANNDVWGNTLVDNTEVGIQLNPVDGKSMAGTKVHGNIVTLPAHVGENVIDLDPSLVNAQDFYNNIYVGASSQALIDGRPLSSWQSLGGDKGSSVVSDPGFSSTAGGDYSLKAGSYALSHGFTDLPWNDMGMTSDASPTPSPTPTPTPIPTPAPGGGSTLNGTSGNDLLNGSGGNDTINGLNGNDTLDGKAGNDVLSGGAEQDKFVFDTALNAQTNVDTITDFKPMTDEVFLSHAVFSALPTGDLRSAAFYVGAAAHDQSDRIVYNANTGQMFYDSDGTGKAPQVEFAKIGAHLDVSYKDFFVV